MFGKCIIDCLRWSIFFIKATEVSKNILDKSGIVIKAINNMNTNTNGKIRRNDNNLET